MARQVRKTFTIKEFGDQHFSGQCHVVDLEKYPDWIKVFEKDGEICPIEVKSGASGKLRSLHQLLKEYPKIKQGYVLSTVPFGSITEQKLNFLPLYYAWSLAQD